MKMLEYAKTVLQKVSFDTDLFLKEFFKLMGWLSHEEAAELKNWVQSNHREKLKAKRYQ